MSLFTTHMCLWRNPEIDAEIHAHFHAEIQRINATWAAEFLLREANGFYCAHDQCFKVLRSETHSF